MHDIKLIALDMDGTLLDADHDTIPQRNVDALRAAAAQGVHIAIASGRSWSLVREYAERLGCVDFAITANGAYALDTRSGEEMASFPMDCAQCVEIIRILRRWDLAFELYIGGENYMDEGQIEEAGSLFFSPGFMDMFRRNVTSVPDVAQVAGRKEPGKFDIFYVPQDIRAQVAGQIAATGPLAFTGALGTNMELNAPGVHKGRALAALCERLGLTPEQVMAFGDADNDLEMLAYAHWSFAMENATAEAKAAARYITGPNHAGGVGMAVEAYVLGGSDRSEA